MPLIGTQWNLVSIENEDITHDFALRPFIVFDSVGVVHGNLGCNSFFGDFTLLRKNKLDIDYRGATKRLCPKMEVERKYISALKQDIDHYEIHGDELILLSGKIEIMRFKGVDLNKVE